MRPPLALSTLALLLIALGCSDPSERPPASTRPTAPPAAPAPAPRAAPRPLAVAPISTEPSSADAEQLARELNLAGMDAYNHHDDAAAIARFVAALEADPAAHQARYNLACALARSGDGGGALDQLEQLRDAACLDCREKLGRARIDKDLEILRGHPRFEALFGN